MPAEKQSTAWKSYPIYHGRFDPCPPIGHKWYATPPHLYLGVQPANLEQFSYQEALKKGTLWKVLYDPYQNPSLKGKR